MWFDAAEYSDIGTTKEVNQDSCLIEIAQTDVGDVALTAVADGMGGLSGGELASAAVVRALSEWFEQKLPLSLEAMAGAVGGFEQYVEGQWNGLVQELNLKIMRHGNDLRERLGTTLTALLAVGGRYSIVHVGDCRAYEITGEGVGLLTHDQTFVQREVDAGNMTPEEAREHPKRSVLLQCIGSSKEVVPAVTRGNLRTDAVYLICSDGFRHVLTTEELRLAFAPAVLEAPWGQGVEASLPARFLEDVEPEGAAWAQTARARIQAMANVVKARGEADNLTACVLRVQKEGGR